MYPDDNNMPGNTVGVASEKTIRNVKRAQAFGLWMGPLHIEWKFWIGHFIFWPRWQFMTTEFFNEGPVRWFRGYWLTVGVSVYRLLPERRRNLNRRQYDRPVAHERRGMK